LPIDLVVTEESVDGVLELCGGGILARRHDGVEEAKRHGPVYPGDDRGIEKRPGGSQLRRDGVVEVVQEGVLADGGTEEGVPLAVDAGVERQFHRDVALDGGETDGLGMERGEVEEAGAGEGGGGEGKFGHGCLGLGSLLVSRVVVEGHGGEIGEGGRDRWLQREAAEEGRRTT
jgi:hypothetical protein